MIKKVEQREFVRHFSKYLAQGGDFWVEGRGGMKRVLIGDLPKTNSSVDVHTDLVPGSVVGNLNLSKSVVSDDDIERVLFDDKKLKRINFYGCGCKKEDGETMCTKHSRL